MIAERGISFEDIVFNMQQGQLLDDIEHPNRGKYPEQRIFVIDVDKYVSGGLHDVMANKAFQRAQKRAANLNR